MKVEENVYLGKLFDSYSSLLSQGQAQVMDKFLNDDLTVSEIAQNLGVSRQAVKDSLSKAEVKLKNLECKLKFVEKIDKLESEIELLKAQILKK